MIPENGTKGADLQNWNFNLRRANIGLAKYAEENGGYDPPVPKWSELIGSLILVDSTRRGKVSETSSSTGWC